MMHFIIQNYENNDLDTWIKSCEIKNKLDKMGIKSFDPILYIHHYSKWAENKRTYYYYECDGRKKEDALKDYPIPDILSESLDKCKRFFNNDGFAKYTCKVCGHVPIYEPNPKNPICDLPHCLSKLTSEVHYDTGCIMLFDESCFINVHENIELNHLALVDDQLRASYSCNSKTIWNSKIAKEIYKLAKKHDVRCLLLRDFFKGVETEI